jgi:low affinity Fe/Cu permease
MPDKKANGGHPADAALEKLSMYVTRWAGSSWGFAAAVFSLVVWAGFGPATGYSETWQLVINTGTTIVTFVMVFLIQRSQNKDARAILLKLDAILEGLTGVSNRWVAVEDLSETELDALHQRFQKLAQSAKEQADEVRRARS